MDKNKAIDLISAQNNIMKHIKIKQNKKRIKWKHVNEQKKSSNYVYMKIKCRKQKIKIMQINNEIKRSYEHKIKNGYSLSYKCIMSF